MLAYAANRPQVAAQRPSPKTLLLVIAAHVAAVALILMVKPELGQRIVHPPIIVNLVRPPVPPPPNPTRPHPTQQQTHPTIYTPPTRTPAQEQPEQQVPSAFPSLPNAGEPGGTVLPQQQPLNFNQPIPVPTSRPAQPLTPPSELKPPYPESKLLTGEEATLTLRLTVDETGHVAAVDPIGRADAVFLASARRHLMAHWRYKPAMQGGRAVASTLVVTLRFELDD